VPNDDPVLLPVVDPLPNELPEDDEPEGPEL
jgi:hypothetical protein